MNRIVCVGGGPAGLYTAILARLAMPRLRLLQILGERAEELGADVRFESRIGDVVADLVVIADGVTTSGSAIPPGPRGPSRTGAGASNCPPRRPTPLPCSIPTGSAKSPSPTGSASPLRPSTASRKARPPTGIWSIWATGPSAEPVW